MSNVDNAVQAALPVTHRLLLAWQRKLRSRWSNVLAISACALDVTVERIHECLVALSEVALKHGSDGLPTIDRHQVGGSAESGTIATRLAEFLRGLVSLIRRGSNSKASLGRALQYVQRELHDLAELAEGAAPVTTRLLAGIAAQGIGSCGTL